MVNVSHLNVSMDYDSVDEAFPAIDCGHVPLGSRVILQIRRPKKVTKGGVHLTTDARETEQWNTQIGKVVSIGPLAFQDRKTGKPWPEGAWCEIGDFLRVPKHGGDRWQVPVPGERDDHVIFAIFNDIDLIAKVKDPLAIKAFV